MKEKVYIETSFISFLTAQPSSDIHQMSRQIESQQWWKYHRNQFELFASDSVLLEAAKGAPEAAKRRLEILDEIYILDITTAARDLAGRLVAPNLLPKNASEDALHIAVCSIHGIDYLLTWNCKHLANAVIRRQVHHFLADEGLASPEICTPFELLEK